MMGESENTSQRKKAVARLNKALRKPLRAMIPPDDITVTQWAERKRRLTSESSAETGRWRTSRTPYLKDIMDCFTDPNIRRIVFVAASQVGKSEVMNNCIGYIIDEDPGSILFVHPTVTDAKDYSLLRIAPMIRDCPTLNAKVAAPKSRDSGNTILQKKYPGGILTMCGSTEAHALASKPIRYLFGDERDRWAASAGKEGDPWGLALARQKTFYNAVAFEASTCTVKGHSPIADSYSKGTMERYCTKCPQCGDFHEIRFSDIRFEYETSVVNHITTYEVKTVWYVCPGCGAISTEREMKHSPAKWIATNPAAYAKGVRSFWLNAFVSPWVGWEKIILEFLEARGDSRKMQVVYNTSFGELWEERGDLEDEDSLLSRREDYGTRADGSEIELPNGVLVLTCGVDTQDDRLEFEILGHGHFGETWGIKRGVIMGRPDSDEVWDTLDDIISHRYTFENGVALPVSCTFVDEGGHFTREVREQCKKRIAKHMYCIKGRGGSDIPYTSPPKKQSIMYQQKVVGYCWQYQIGVDAGKQIIMDNLKVQTPGPKYCHFPRRDEYGYAYFFGLLSEHLVYNEKRRNPWSWEKIPGHERNEPLDCRNYALAAFRSLAVDLDAVDQRMKAMASGGIPLPAQSVRPSARQKKKKSVTEKYYDEW